jgi:hypothetical protein
MVYGSICCAWIGCVRERSLTPVEETPNDASVPVLDAAAAADAVAPPRDASDASRDANSPDAAPDAGPLSPSQQLARVRSAANSTTLSLAVSGVTVTHLKVLLGTPANDPAGFTVQAEKTGPALFVAVDPASLNPAPTVGDVVSFTVTGVNAIGTLRVATAIASYARSASGTDVAPLVQNLSATANLVSQIATYESELADITGTLSADFVQAGAAFQQATLATAGVPASADLRLRVPETLRAALDLAPGCTVAIKRTPVGRFNAAVQIAAYTAADIVVSSCPAPVVSSATSLSPTSLRVTFSKQIDPASVALDGSQFTFDNGLVATAASVNGKTVELTTSAQLPATSYLVTVDSALKDFQGTMLAAPLTATFIGFTPTASLMINELNANIASGCDLIELRVLAGGALGGFKLMERDTMLFTFPSMLVHTNDVLVLHMNGASTTCNPNASADEVTGPMAQPRATYGRNYDTAYDFYSADTGLTNTDNTFTLYSADGTIHDAVLVADAPTGTAAAASESQAALVAAANQWSKVGGGVPAGGYVDDDFRMHAALDLNATGTAPMGDSIQRAFDSDSNTKSDWVQVGSSFGLLNVGQTPQ